MFAAFFQNSIQTQFEGKPREVKPIKLPMKIVQFSVWKKHKLFGSFGHLVR